VTAPVTRPACRHSGVRGTTATQSARLTVAEVCEDLGIARSTFNDWRVKGKAPRCIKLPNGEIRIRRHEYERWLESLEEAA